MSIKLDEERTVFPAVKFNAKGDYVDVAVIRIETIPLKAYGSGAPIIGSDGQPRSQTRLTGLVVGGPALIKDGDALRPVQANELVSLYLKGLSRYEFFQAKKKLDGGMLVGDFMRWKYTDDAPGQAPGTTKKVYTINIKHPDAKDAERTAECEKHYNAIMGAGTPAAYEPYEDQEPEEDPFE